MMSTGVRSRRFHLANLVWAITISALLSACGGQAPTPTSEPDPAPEQPIVEVFSGVQPAEKRVIDTETINQNNCGEGGPVSNVIERSRTIAHTASLGGSISVNASGEAGIPGVGTVQVGTEIAREYGDTYGEEETISRSLTVTAEQGTNIINEIEHFEIWRTGTISITDANQEVSYPYEFRTDFGIELKGRTYLDCPVLTATPTSTAPPTLTPPPTATALVDAYGGTWLNSRSFSGTLPFALYRLKIENVNSQNGTATFSVCRCTQKDNCDNKANLVPAFVSAEFDGSKLVTKENENAYIDQQRTAYWTLKAIKDGQNLRVTVEQYQDGQRVAGPEDFVLEMPEGIFPGGLGGAQVLDACQRAPEIYLGP